MARRPRSEAGGIPRAETIAEKVAHVRAAPAQREREHTCHARGPKHYCKPAHLMCPRHWRLVPRPLQAQVWKYYRVGQEDGEAEVSREYLGAMEAAIRAVWLAEHGPCRAHRVKAGARAGETCLDCGAPAGDMTETGMLLDPTPIRVEGEDKPRRFLPPREKKNLESWRALVAWPEEAKQIRYEAQLWQWRLHADSWVALRPRMIVDGHALSRAVFAFVLADATEKRPGRDGLNDIPRSRARIFLGGTDRELEVAEIPNVLVLRYSCEREARELLGIPGEWLAEAKTAREVSDARAVLLAARQETPASPASGNPKQLKMF